jgi:hypothetical protein
LADLGVRRSAALRSSAFMISGELLLPKLGEFILDCHSVGMVGPENPLPVSKQLAELIDRLLNPPAHT